MAKDVNNERPARATIRHVAALAGVDISLVSRVLNESPKAGATAETRERIVAAARSLNYRPNIAARSLRTAKAWTLGVLLPNFSNPLYTDIAAAAEQRAQERGFGLVFGSHVDGAKEETFTRLLVEGRVDGLLVASGLLSDSFLRGLSSAGAGPFALVNRRVRGLSPAVTVDDRAGAALATTHLIELGHTRIAGIFGPARIDTSQRRRKGFLDAAAQAGLDPVVVEADSWSANAGRIAAEELLRRHKRVTGIFASSFEIGMGTLRTATERGVMVPDDLSVVALHDSGLADYLNPRLTTVALPVQEMAHRAIDLLIELVDGASPSNEMIKTAPQLLRRESTDVIHSNV